MEDAPPDQPLDEVVPELPPMAALVESSPSGGGLPSARDDVPIADYKLIKRIGSGAYGEVWLAQSITGSLRAVKIIWREDFELTKTFHREFEGMQQFEPISRGHPGLVHVLHVGWNEERGYYYYVMELADDAVEGPHITDTAAYSARTLSSDMKQHGRLDLHFCQEAGAFIADALHYMHERGLTHRDIKPSNIIYCGGVCKLADIGMVASFGERSFVGTEGFVPPEGPGTPQADLYSLGKVLYEMSSGKDRMEFPEVPDDIDPTEWPFWLNFNRVICRACAPDLSERYQTCAEFAEALRAVTGYQPPSLMQKLRTVVTKAALFVMLSLLAGGAWASYKHQQSWVYQMPLPQKPPPPSLTPEAGKPWQSATKLWFSFKKDRHIADQPIDYSLFYDFLIETNRPFESEVGKVTKADKTDEWVVVVPPEDANDFCVWMTERERKRGRLTDAYECAWKPYKGVVKTTSLKPLNPKWSAILCEIVKVQFGVISVASTPAPAEVFIGGQKIGNTPLTNHKVKAGAVELEVHYPGYKSEVLKGVVKVGETKPFSIKLKNISAVIFGKPWTNTLKMKLVPLGNAMIGATEVTRGQFREFVRARKLPAMPERDLDDETKLDLPVTFVSRADARSYCEWLTEKEQSGEIIEGEHHYRLPTDDEWSMAANMPREAGDSPADKHLHIQTFYPWGFTWPPVPQPGNLFDETAAKKAGNGAKSIEGYNDGFEGVAPVGKFRPDWRGVMDLAGNVWEWVDDDFGGSDEKNKLFGTSRGGAWTTSDRQELLASYRRALGADSRVLDVGFRVLLSTNRPARDDD